MCDGIIVESESLAGCVWVHDSWCFLSSFYYLLLFLILDLVCGYMWLVLQCPWDTSPFLYFIVLREFPLHLYSQDGILVLSLAWQTRVQRPSEAKSPGITLSCQSWWRRCGFLVLQIIRYSGSHCFSYRLLASLSTFTCVS